MSEIGGGGGSSYPGALDSDSTLETNSDVARIQVPNDLAACIVAIETELGADPAGSFATVVARLNAISNSTGGGVARGIAANRPSASDGIIYHSIDVGVIEWSDGSAWHAFMSG